jgi:hypothetical protein
MAKGLDRFELKKFFNDKTILPNNKFYVTIIDKSQYGGGDRNILLRAGLTPILEHWHVLSVKLPSYDFKKEAQKYGPLPRSFAVLDYDGLELSINFEEDENGTIGNFINILQRRIIDRDGLYSAPAKMKLDKIIVQIEDHHGKPTAIYTFSNCFYLKSNEVNYAYDGNESVKYDVIFNADYYNVVFPRAQFSAAKHVISNIKNLF